MGRIVVELGALMGTKGILDGQLVQAELARELVELLLGRSAEVDPHHGVRLLEVLGHIGDGKVFCLEHTASVHPASDLTHSFLHPQ